MPDDHHVPRPMRVLVAGGAGFVGSHLCEALLGAGHEVICLDSFVTGARENLAGFRDHPRFALVEHDICEPLGPGPALDRIYNLACAASPRHYQADPMHTMMTCVLGVRNLLLHAERHGARFLQASTSEIYGDPLQHPQREDYLGHVNCTGPRACYDEGKRAAETMCFDMARAGRLDVRVARIFNTYGPRMQTDDGRIVSNLIWQALAGEPLTIYGSGEQTRAFCYVSDMVAGLIALMEARPAPSSAVNLGNPGEFTILDLAREVVRLTGSRSELSFGPLPQDDPRRRRPDIGLARALLGWEPQVPLAEGLRLTIEHVAARRRPAAAAAPRRARPGRRIAAARGLGEMQQG